jgi:hypothetical protein
LEQKQKKIWFVARSNAIFAQERKKEMLMSREVFALLMK